MIMIATKASVVFGDLNFSSDFTGGTNWNWTSAVGDVSGTNEFVGSYGDPVAPAYVSYTITNPSEESPDGTGHLKVKFSIDLSDFSYSGWYSGPYMFYVTSIGNRAMWSMSFANWKSDTGAFRLSVSTGDIYQGGGSFVMSTLYPSEAMKPWIYDVESDYYITYESNAWHCTFSSTVIGPAGNK